MEGNTAPVLLPLAAREGGSTDRFEGIGFSDVVIEIETAVVHGQEVQRPVVVSVLGEPLSSIRHPELRVICSRLGVSGYKNKRKDEMAKLIAAKKMNEEIYDVAVPMHPSASDMSTTIHCRFRLINTIFSDEFAEAFSSLGDTLTRHDLDGPVSKDDLFWKALRERFVDETALDIGKLQFSHAAFANQGIDPARVVPHSSVKLRSIYVDVRAHYKAASARSKRSGEHGEFYSYCEGRVDCLYLHLHIQQRPNLGDAVDAALPSATFVDSEARWVESDNNGPAHTPAKRQRSSGAMMAEALNNFVEYTKKSDISHHRSALYTARDARESARERREQQEHDQRSALLRLQEWERLSDRIRVLQRELKREDDQDIRAEMAHDIIVMKARKENIEI